MRLDIEGLRGLQYALDNLQYAQHHAGGARSFWRLLAQDQPMCRGTACPTGWWCLCALRAKDLSVPCSATLVLWVLACRACRAGLPTTPMPKRSVQLSC